VFARALSEFPSPRLYPVREYLFRGARAQEGRVRGSADPTPSLKLAAEVRKCIWRLCRTGVKVMAMTTCLTWLLTFSRLLQNGSRAPAVACEVLQPGYQKNVEVLHWWSDEATFRHRSHGVIFRGSICCCLQCHRIVWERRRLLEQWRVSLPTDWAETNLTPVVLRRKSRRKSGIQLSLLAPCFLVTF